jgi:hypothetical protein
VSSTARTAPAEQSSAFICLCHHPLVQTETPMRWCPECHEARRTTITYEDERSADGNRLATSAVCDRGHAFDPYS